MTSLLKWTAVFVLNALVCTICHANALCFPIIRVKLARFFPPTNQSVVVTSEGPFTICDQMGAVLVQAPAQSTYILSSTPTGQVSVSNPNIGGDAEESEQEGVLSGSSIIIHAPDDIPIGVSTDAPQSALHYYRGDIIASPGLSLVDVIPLEDYLKGVLLPEIGGSAPLEALKAQAVASRTYTIHNLGKMAVSGADMDDTTRTQSYLGVAGETPLICEAVADTSGQVLTYKGALIDAVFSTDCGGVTADGGATLPYLTPVSDPECAVEPEWQFTLTQAEALLILGSSSLAAGPPVTVTVAETDSSGRVASLILAQGLVQRTITGNQLRQLAGYDQVRSTLFKLTAVSDGSYLITGKGWGHGLGLCQKGAIYLADHSCLYTSILRHYYTGADIVQLQPFMLVQPVSQQAIVESTPALSTPPAP